MKRRPTVSGRTPHTRRHKTATRKAGNKLKGASHRGSSATGKRPNAAQLACERDEALEQLSAASEVLRVISSSPGELQPVFETMLESATRLCEAQFGNLFLRVEGTEDSFHYAAMHGLPSAYLEWGKRDSLVVLSKHPHSPLAQVVRTKDVDHTTDITAARSYVERDPRIVALVETAGARTHVMVPLLKNSEAVGALAIYRQEVRPFSNKQIELVKNFAAQAVVAIENGRLLNELRESLDRQTATADILRVIASTPEDSKRALDTIAETALRMFDAANVNFRRLEGNVLRMVSSAGPNYATLREVLPDAPLEPTDPAVRSVFENRQIAVEDRHTMLLNEHGEIARAIRNLPERSLAFTPLSREGNAEAIF